MGEINKKIGKETLNFIIKHKYFLITFVVLAVLARLYGGQLDLAISNYFFKDGEFYLKNSFLAVVVHYGVHLFVATFLTIITLFLIYTLITKKTILKLNKKALIFILVSFIIAPGIIANLILKENVGRPRPVNCIEFNGDKHFQPPFKITNECKSNCSFVSGHASSAFTFLLFGFFFRGKTRKIVFSSAFIVGTIVSIGRIIQGRHFFTDTFFAFFFVWLTILIIYEIMYKNDDLPESLK